MNASTHAYDTTTHTVAVDDPRLPKPRLQCRHILASGCQCGSPSMREEIFCFFHHTTRKPIPRSEIAERQGHQATFDLPMPDDRTSVQMAIGEILRRIALNEIDRKRAGLLLYGLQIASSNLPKDEKSQWAFDDSCEVVDAIVVHPEHGPIAAESHSPLPPRGHAEQLRQQYERENLIRAEQKRFYDRREDDLRHEIKRDYRLEFRAEIKAQLRTEIETDLRKHIEAELRTELHLTPEEANTVEQKAHHIDAEVRRRVAELAATIPIDVLPSLDAIADTTEWPLATASPSLEHRPRRYDPQPLGPKPRRHNSLGRRPRYAARNNPRNNPSATHQTATTPQPNPMRAAKPKSNPNPNHLNNLAKIRGRGVNPKSGNSSSSQPRPRSSSLEVSSRLEHSPVGVARGHVLYGGLPQ